MQTDRTQSPWPAWAWRVGFALLAAVYVSALWGKAALVLPPPFDQWHQIPYRTLFWAWSARVVPDWPPAHQRLWYLFLEIWLFGLVLPVVALRLLHRPLADFGLAAPNRPGWRMTPLFMTASIPVGFLLFAVLPMPPTTPARFLVALVAMIPEHFLFFGVCLAAMLPRHRLTGAESGPHGRPGGWRDAARIDAATAFAILAVGALFCMAHAGKREPLETILSFPAGLFSAYVTLRSGSIWPAVLAHWSLNLVPYFVLRAVA
ncbi:MAG: CPBP family intramembrane metalloprotease [Hyphomicrobiales bacterium]|nr:CPBP family intramembrane metalloprotease [Hyphomicrobiales bacterium]